jgi:hypothetical protein
MALGLTAAGAKIAVVGRSADKNQAAVAKITEAACEAIGGTSLFPQERSGS